MWCYDGKTTNVQIKFVSVPYGYICINNHLPNSDLLLKVFEGSMAYYIMRATTKPYFTQGI